MSEFLFHFIGNGHFLNFSRILLPTYGLRTSKKWLDAQSEPNLIQRTYPAFLAFVDLQNDNYVKLVTVEIPKSFSFDQKPKLKVYKGTTLMSEQNLPGIPSSLKSLYIDDNDNKIPGKECRNSSDPVNLYIFLFNSEFMMQ